MRTAKVLSADVERATDSPIGDLPQEIELPAKDRPIFLSAVTARATHLLTGDRAHFGPYFGLTIAGVRIERPADYLRRESWE